MANTNTPFGLRPSQYSLGTGWSGQTRTYYIPSTDGNAYAVGDPVKTLSGGADPSGVPAVTLATAGTGNAIRGVITGVGGTVYGGPGGDPTAPQQLIIPAAKTKGYYVQVIDDPYAVFEIQEYDVTGTVYTVADVGKNANLKSGVNNGVVSGWTLDNTAASNTGSTVQLRLLQIQPVALNTVGAYQAWLVLINNHELKAGTAGV